MDDSFRPEERLYRGIHAMFLDGDRITSAAFKDSGGVSVDRDGGRNEDDCIERLITALPQISGVGRLTYADVESCGAVTIYCPTTENVYHSQIQDSKEQVKIPNSKAKKLASCCYLVYKKQ
jgi:hypothetical protein